ncbi:hypothetical protein B0H14DRAFT_2578985 [Mycena olivaceomarginata]|nr:hypothetical protein B0H14DRAFT_2578985 [Mycena olivaceomarginata]
MALARRKAKLRQLSEAEGRRGGSGDGGKWCRGPNRELSTVINVEKARCALKGKGDNQVGDEKPVNRAKPDRKKSCKSGGINASNHKWRDRTDQGSLQNAQKSAGRMRERGKNSPQWPALTNRGQHRHEANQVFGNCILRDNLDQPSKDIPSKLALKTLKYGAGKGHHVA